MFLFLSNFFVYFFCIVFVTFFLILILILSFFPLEMSCTARRKRSAYGRACVLSPIVAQYGRGGKQGEERRWRHGRPLSYTHLILPLYHSPFSLLLLPLSHFPFSLLLLPLSHSPLPPFTPGLYLPPNVLSPRYESRHRNAL